MTDDTTPNDPKPEHAEAAEQDAPELSKDEQKRLKKLESRFSSLVNDYASLVEELDDVYAELAELGSPPEEPLAAPRASDAEGLEQKAADADAAYRRVLADYSNFQRRAHENEERARQAGRAGVLESMVEVLDIFGLAAQMNPETTTPKAMLQGIEMIRSEMLRKLEAQGFRAIEPKPGEEFDPHSHEATGHEDDAAVEPGCVVRVQKPGYVLGSRVLRPASVTVRPGAHAGGDGGGENEQKSPENPSETPENTPAGAGREADR